MKVKCACTIFISYTNLPAHFGFKKMMQATAYILFNAVNFIGAAKAYALVFCISAHVDNR